MNNKQVQFNVQITRVRSNHARVSANPNNIHACRIVCKLFRKDRNWNEKDMVEAIKAEKQNTGHFGSEHGPSMLSSGGSTI